MPACPMHRVSGKCCPEGAGGSRRSILLLSGTSTASVSQSAGAAHLTLARCAYVSSVDRHTASPITDTTCSLWGGNPGGLVSKETGASQTKSQLRVKRLLPP